MTEINKQNPSSVDKTQAEESSREIGAKKNAAEQSAVQVINKKRQFESRLKNSLSKNSSEQHATKLDKQIKTALKVVGGRVQELPNKRKLPSDQQANQNLNAHEHNHQHIAQMQAESMKETQQATVQQPQDVKPMPQSLHKVVEEIANRVLISSQDAQNAEVRIQLKSSVFGGSDIRIFREHGELKVMFVASSQEAQNQISQHVSKMESMLRERMPQEKIRVRVEGKDKDREGQSGQQTKQ